MKKSLFFIAVISIIGGSTMTQTTCKDGVCSLENTKQSTERIESKKEGAVTELTAENFNQVITTSEKPVIVDFYATWCGPCKVVKPFFAELSTEEPEWLFYSLDVDKASAIATQCKVSGMPSFVIFKKGVQWGMVTGAFPKEQLRREFKEIIEASAPQIMDTVIPNEITKQLITAIAQRKFDDVKKLVQEGADVNGVLETPVSRVSVMQAAILAGDTDIIDYLLGAGALFNTQVQESVEKQLTMIEATLDRFDADLAYTRAKKDVMAPMMADAVVNQELGNQFLNVSMDSASLKELLAQGVDVNCVFAVGTYTMTPLYFAILTNNRTAIDMLVDAGARLSVTINNDKGQQKTIEQALEAEMATMRLGIATSKKCLAHALSKPQAVPADAK